MPTHDYPRVTWYPSLNHLKFYVHVHTVYHSSFIHYWWWYSAVENFRAHKIKEMECIVGLTLFLFILPAWVYSSCFLSRYSFRLNPSPSSSSSPSSPSLLWRFLNPSSLSTDIIGNCNWRTWFEEHKHSHRASNTHRHMHSTAHKHRVTDYTSGN